jgi:bis(5'-nucleosyl)-tetraphosphatase (symmetrical)
MGDLSTGRTFAIGDIQGCLEPLKQLLDRVGFNENKDTLWCVGDLVNRGPDSLGTLEFLYSIRKSLKVVLGNHDLHLLAVAYGEKKVKPESELLTIAASDNAEKILKWLRKQPLVQWDKERNLAMSHAGIPPMWSVKKAKALSDEVQLVLKSDQHYKFYRAMYGNEPDTWSDDLKGMERLRVITNYLTRMRFLGENNELEFENKATAKEAGKGFKPWFEYENKLKKNHLLFGHWAALGGVFDQAKVTGLDTGCVWGGPMTLMNVDTNTFFKQYL